MYNLNKENKKLGCMGYFGNKETLVELLVGEKIFQQISNKMVGSNYPALNSTDIKKTKIIVS